MDAECVMCFQKLIIEKATMQIDKIIGSLLLASKDNLEVFMTGSPQPQNGAREPRYSFTIEGPRRLIEPLALFLIDGGKSKKKKTKKNVPLELWVGPCFGKKKK